MNIEEVLRKVIADGGRAVDVTDYSLPGIPMPELRQRFAELSVDDRQHSTCVMQLAGDGLDPHLRALEALAGADSARHG